MNNKFDIAIIGGGPAGSCSAIRLAREGLNVCLIEKFVFPREVLCGEFLSREVSNELKKLKLFERFIELNPNKIKSFRLVNDNGRELKYNFKFESFALKRSVFDNFLLEEAKISGAKVFQPAEVKRIIKKGNEYYLEVKNEENEINRIAASFVIAAYGKRNILDKQLERNFVSEKSELNGIKFHVDKKYLPGFANDRVEIYSSRGIYCGLNALNENTITLCFLENRKDFSGSPMDHFMRLIDKNKKFAEIFSSDFDPGNKNMQAYGSGNIFFGKRELVNDGIFMVGDAAGVIAPLAGDGIGMALESSSILASLLNNGIKSKTDPKILEQNYIFKWNNKFKKRLMVAGLIQNVVFHSSLKNIGVGIVQKIPGILPKFVELTRG